MTQHANGATLVQLADGPDLNIRELAEMTSYSRGHLRHLIAIGALRAEEIGGAYYVQRAEMNRYIQERSARGLLRPHVIKRVGGRDELPADTLDELATAIQRKSGELSALHRRIGAALRVHRQRNGMSLADMARAISVSTAYVSLIETGRAHPRLEVIERMIAHIRRTA